MSIGKKPAADATFEMLRGIASAVRESPKGLVDIERIARKLGASRIERTATGSGVPGALQASEEVMARRAVSTEKGALASGGREVSSVLADPRWRRRMLRLLRKSRGQDPSPYAIVESAVAQASGSQKPLVKVLLLDEGADRELDEWLKKHSGAWQVPRDDVCE